MNELSTPSNRRSPAVLITLAGTSLHCGRRRRPRTLVLRKLRTLAANAGALLWLTIATAVFSSAQETEPPPVQADVTAETHDELRALRDRMFAAYEARDMNTLLNDVADDVVITWQNGERNLGHEEFLAFYDRMVNGDNPVVKDMSSQFDVDDLSLLYGDDTAVAYGTLRDTFALTDGSEFTLDSKWTATVVNENDAWKVASFHVSSNIFDNPILGFAQSWLAKAAIGGGIIGLVIGLILGRATKRAS